MCRAIHGVSFKYMINRMMRKNMKVFISYAHQDKNKAFYLKERLEKNGFEILGDFNLKIGENFKSVLDAELLKADAVVMLITEHYIASQFASREAATAYAYNEAGKEVKLFPIVFDGVHIPSFLESILYIPVRNDNFEDASIKLFASLNLLREEKENLKRTTEEEAETFKESKTEFIKKTLDRLEKNEKRNRRMGYVCYIAACICLVFSVLYSLNRTNLVFQLNEWQMAISKTISGVLTLVLILALGRLLFVLGKSFMVESIRNSDRIHAISFGEFYLNVYGKVATRDEVREVFGNWNIDNGSSFISQSPKDYDPQILENIALALDGLKDKISK